VSEATELNTILIDEQDGSGIPDDTTRCYTIFVSSDDSSWGEPPTGGTSDVTVTTADEVATNGQFGNAAILWHNQSTGKVLE